MASKLVLGSLSYCLLLALGRGAAVAAPTDASALLQQTVQSHSQGVPDEPEPGQAMDSEDKEPIKVGDRMEVIALEGPSAGQWLKCKVVREGERPNSFDIMLSSGAKRFVPSVPANALRKRMEENEKSDGVLLFWAVSGRPNIMELVKKNIEHLHSNYSGRADVYLVHYDGLKEDWLDADSAWYEKNVQFTEEKSIPKRTTSVASMLFAQEYYPPQVSFARKLAPELLARRQYDWVWLLDEDVDFSKTDLNKLFKDAMDTDAPIVAPSVKFEDRYRAHPETKMYVAGCTIATPMCFMHAPRQHCNYRYTNYVEAMFALLKPEVLTDLAACTDCEKAIDRLWCARVARTTGTPADSACAILDKSTVVHTNGKTLRKWEAVSSLHDNLGDVRGAYPTDFVDGGDLADFRCVH